MRASTDLAAAEKKTPIPESANYDGIIRLREGQTSLAIASFKQALDLAGAKAEPALLRAIYLNLVDASVQARSLSEAERYLKSAWARQGSERPGAERAALP